MAGRRQRSLSREIEVNMRIEEYKVVEKAALGREYPKAQTGTHAITGMGVHVARLAALKGGIKLEARGMKRRGKSCTQIVRQMFGLPVSTSREVLIERLEREILELAQP